MSETDWKAFEYWKELYEDQHIGFDQPFRTESLTSSTVFMWSRVTAPLPCPVEGRLWEWFPETKALVGYLRFVVLPRFFATWLCSDEGNSTHETLIRAETIFTEAADISKNDYIKDIPLMRKLIAKLDELLNTENEQMILEIRKITDDYSNRWKDTPTWESEIQVFKSLTEVGEVIVNRLELDEDLAHAYFYLFNVEDFESWKSSLLDISQKALSDKDSRSKLFRVLEEIEC